jgi:O-acetyl-ADP-ribose deacetylase (regulator of RNase III)
MIHEVSGDILLTKAQAIAHGVAPNDHFDSGLALTLRQRWPVMVKDFRHFAHQEHPKAGAVWFWGGTGGARIYSLMTQEGRHEQGARPGKASLTNVAHALTGLKKQLVADGIESLALPRLATGVGGLDWNDVLPLVRQHLGDLPIPVYVYSTFHAGVTADEPIPAKRR